jgi:hypothetical protein
VKEGPSIESQKEDKTCHLGIKLVASLRNELELHFGRMIGLVIVGATFGYFLCGTDFLSQFSMLELKLSQKFRRSECVRYLTKNPQLVN